MQDIRTGASEQQHSLQRRLVHGDSPWHRPAACPLRPPALRVAAVAAYAGKLQDDWWMALKASTALCCCRSAMSMDRVIQPVSVHDPAAVRRPAREAVHHSGLPAWWMMVSTGYGTARTPVMTACKELATHQLELRPIQGKSRFFSSFSADRLTRGPCKDQTRINLLLFVRDFISCDQMRIIRNGPQSH